jgi:hypothetical protein
MVWGSSDGGANWSKRSFIDPRDSKLNSGRYGDFQNSIDAGGWDREEVYGDPWSGEVYITANGTGGINPSFADDLLFRSVDKGINWTMMKISTGRSQPTMMTSLPGKLFMAECYGVNPTLPRLRWYSPATNAIGPSPDGLAVTWQSGFTDPKHGAESECMILPLGRDDEGSLSVSRVGQYINDKGVNVSVVRVIYPSVVSIPGGGKKQVLRFMSVSVPDDGSPAVVNNVRTIEAADKKGSIIEAATVEADPNQVSGPENTILVYWKETSVSTGLPRSAIRGVVLRDTNGFSPVFDVSADSTGKPRSWLGTTLMTGDFTKGGFYFNASKNELRYFVQWIEGDADSNTSLHTKLIAVPR